MTGMKDLRSDVAARLRSLDQGWAARVSAPETTLSPVPAPFLRSSFVLKVDDFNPSGPLTLFVGCAPGDQTFVLNGDAAALERLIAVDGARIVDEAGAAALAELFVRVTMSGRGVVRGVDELPWRPNLSPENEAKRAAAVARLGEVIRPPSAVARPGGGWEASVFVVEEMGVLQLRLLVAGNGQTSVAGTTAVADGLPFVYVM